MHEEVQVTEEKGKKIADSEIRNLFAHREINREDGESRSLQNDAIFIYIQKKSVDIPAKYFTFDKY